MTRFRLSATYVAIMLLGLCIFGAATLFAIDRVQRSTLDARLAIAARAAAAFIDVTGQRIVVDADDRRQLLTVLGAQASGAIFDSRGRVLVSSQARLPQLNPFGEPAAFFADAGRGDGSIRVFGLPLTNGAARLGWVLIWRDNDWIEETDRNVAVALGAGALVIVVLALFAGDFVSRRALEDALSRQRRFTADASHELRTPLAVIRAEADLALRVKREPQVYERALQTVAEEADRLERLIGDLLSIARAESTDLRREPVAVGDLLRHVAARLVNAAAAKDAIVEIVGTPTGAIVADSYALERALLAIGHNAIKFTPPSGRIVLQGHVIDHTVHLIVEDGGPGFSEQALAHALGRFWHEPSSGIPEGTGLGLAIARSIVERAGGTISLSNGARGGRVVLRFAATD